MRWFRFAVLVLLATLVQAKLLAHLHITLDLLLILLVFFAGYCNISEVIITSFAIGFAADIISFMMGPQTISFGIFGTLLAYLHRIIAIRKMPYQAAAIFVVGLLTAVLSHFLTLLKAEQGISTAYAPIIGTSVCSAVVGPFLFLPVAWWMHIKTRRFSRR